MCACALLLMMPSFSFRCVITGRHCRPGRLRFQRARASLAWIPVAKSSMIWNSTKNQQWQRILWSQVKRNGSCQCLQSGAETSSATRDRQFHLVRIVAALFSAFGLQFAVSPPRLDVNGREKHCTTKNHCTMSWQYIWTQSRYHRGLGHTIL